MCEHFSAETHMQTLNKKKNIYEKNFNSTFIPAQNNNNSSTFNGHAYLFKKKTLKALIPSLKFTFHFLRTRGNPVEHHKIAASWTATVNVK